MTMSLKEQKEAFVTGHTGTTVLEILVVCVSSPVGLFLWTQTMGRWRRTSAHISASLLEATAVLLPMALCQTSYLYPWGVGLLVLEASVAALTLFLHDTPSSPSTPSNATPTTSRSLAILTFTCYRSTILFLTFVAILAVDFRIFPRRFAKTEVYGYGWMDLGAASFVVAAGLSSSRARGKTRMKKTTSTILVAMGKRVLPLLLLGGIRLATNKGLEYQEHVSEYGVHWNFFFTLAVVTPLASLVGSRRRRGIWTPMALLILYQYALSTQGLQTYVEEGTRQHREPSAGVFCQVFAANREGILGCIGYLALYLSSECIGRLCLWEDKSVSTSVNLWLAAVLLWGAHWFLTSVLAIQVSRRTTNASFCAWALAHNVTMLALIQMVTSTMTHTFTPPILHAINQHGLIVFVVANLLTGLVNISMNTLAASDGMAMLILFLYLAAVSTISLSLELLLPTRHYDGAKKD